MHRKLFLNFSWLTASHIAVKPIWFVFITYVCIRTLGPDEYGSMAAILALMSIVDGMVMMGTGTMTLRDVARQKDLSNTYFSNFLVTRGLLAILGVLIGLGLEYLLGNAALLATAVFAGFYVIARSFTEYARIYFRAHDVFKKEAISTVVEKVLVVGFGSLAIYFAPTAESVLLGMALGMIITALINYRWVIREFAAFSRDLLAVEFVRKAIPVAVPLGLTSVFILLFMRTDSVMIEFFLGEVPTAQYALAFRVLEALFILPSMAVAVLLPKLSVLHETDFRIFRRLSFRAAAGLFVIGALVAGAVGFISSDIITVLDDSVEMAASIPLLGILIWGLPLSAMNAILSTSLTASNQQKSMAIALGVAAVVNIGMNYVLIPEYGPLGAAYATIATQTLVGLSFGVLMAVSRTRT